jgi:CubicO group peptidase (beta-lactamase class C family)
LTTGVAGRHTFRQDTPAITPNTLWDLASLTKVIGTTTAFMMLLQEGKIELDQMVADVIPEFGVNNKQNITFRNLLEHNSGLVAFRPYHLQFTEKERVMDAIYNESLTYATGTETAYSDLSMILVGEAIERLMQTKLDQFLTTNVFEPLGMRDTQYFRLAESPDRRAKCAPTETIEPWRISLRALRYTQEEQTHLFGKEPNTIQGEVHDPTATVLNGVAGHAGLFSTIGDLCLFAQDFMSERQTLVRSDVKKMFTTKQGDQSTRALGWDTKSPIGSSAGPSFGSKSFGHTGYTGTSIWCDPEDGTFAILLTNRVHPTSNNAKIIAFRPRFNDFP